MPLFSQYRIGQVIALRDGRHATVKFAGSTSFQDGDWLGVEFKDAVGKNDGSVQGQRYFDCEMGHGMFIRPDVVDTVISQPPTPKAATHARQPSAATSKATTGSTATSRPGIARPSVGGRPSAVNGRVGDPAAKRRETLNNTSPSPAPRSTTSAASSHARTPSKLGPGAAGRASMVGPSASSRAAAATTAARKPTASTASSSSSRTGTTGSRLSVAGAPAKAPGAATKSVAAPTRTAAARQSISSRTGLAGAAPGTRTSVTSNASRTSASSKPSTTATSGLRQTKREVGNQKPVSKARKDLDDGSSELDEHPGEDSPEEDEPQPNGQDGANDDDDDDDDDAEEDQDGSDGDSAPAQATEPKAKPSRPTAASSRAPAPSRTTATSRPVARSATAATAASSRQIQDLETKLSTLERRRDEDKEKLKTLEKIQSERDRFESIISKLQKKYQPQAEELAELRKRQKETEDKISQLESAAAEHETDLEMVSLDKEMAEEVNEALQSELEALKTKHEEISLEVEVLREENEELSKDLSPEERTTANHYQLQLRLQRTQDALVRLRDVTQDTEADLKSQVEGLEKEIEELRSVKDKYEESQEKLKQTDSIVEDLRAQLETALGAEDMIEELTEKNMTLSEQMESLKLAIQDLEDLKEVNDELEYNHVEAERQMMEELDFKDSVLQEQRQRMLQKDEKLADYEYTISKFRELVQSLQSDIQEMRSSQQISDAEAEELNSRSRAMNDLNLKLQTSAARTVVNSVDMELRRLEAQEAVEHLAIVQMFLPDSFKSERDSVLAYLRFKRVAAKARLLHGQLRERASGGTLAQPVENVFGLCDVLDKLVWISSICDRFSNNISASTLERFAKYEGALYELDPVEKGLNVYIDQLKKADMKEGNVAEELQRTIALLGHLSEVHIPDDDLEAYSDDLLMRTALIQSYLENTTTALSVIKTLIPSTEGEDGEGDSLDTFRQQMDVLVGQTRSAKVISSKALNGLNELKDRSMTLQQAASEEPFELCQDSARDIATLARQLGEGIQKALASSEEGMDSPRSLVRSAISAFASQSGSSDSSAPFGSLKAKLQTVTTQLQGLIGLSQDLSVAVEFERLSPPWIQRSRELKNSSNISATAEAELKRLKDDIHERAMQLRQRDQSIEEQNVKIELLESRTKDVNLKANRITELQRLLEAGKAREKELTEAIEQKFREISQLTSERDHWQRTAHERKPSVEGEDKKEGREKAVASAREMEALKQEISGLKGAVRLLREDNVRIRLGDINDPHMMWLTKPLGRKTTEKEKRQGKLRREGLDVCAALIDAVVHAQPIDLSKLPENKLAWRPAKEKSTWVLARQKERWASWHAMRDGFIGDAAEELGLKVQGLRKPRFQDAVESVVVS